jgi:hypothetical protein
MMRGLTKLSAATLPAVLASAVAAADPAPPPFAPVAVRNWGPVSPPCDAPPAGRYPSPYGGYCPPAVPTVPAPGAVPPAVPPAEPQPGLPPAPAPDLTAPPSPESAPLSFAPESSALALSGGSAAVGLPNMAGSFTGVSYLTSVFARQTTSTVTRQTVPAQFLVVPTTVQIPGQPPRVPPPPRLSNPVAVPVDFVSTTQTSDIFIRAFDATRGAALIAENESPRPQTRAYVRYNYFDGVPATASQAVAGMTVPTVNNPALLAAVQAEIAAQNQVELAAGRPPVLNTPAGAAGQLTNQVLARLTPAQSALINSQVRNQVVNREVFGFEAAFWDDAASVGLRVPVFQQSADGSIGPDDFGDLSVILKGVIAEDRSTGDLLSGGLVVTAPTGPGIPTVDGTIRSVLLQPWVGAIRPVTDRLGTQGFFSVVVPTDDRDVTFLSSDVGLYYFLYRAAGPGALLTALIPAVEAHVITPLNHRGTASTPIGLPDIVMLTGALHTILADRVLMYGAVVVPVTGPQPFDIEAQAVLEYRF